MHKAKLSEEIRGKESESKTMWEIYGQYKQWFRGTLSEELEGESTKYEELIIVKGSKNT